MNDGLEYRKNNFRVLYAVIKRELLIWSRYPMFLISVTVAQLFWALIYVATYNMFTGPSGTSSTLFETFTGTSNYPAFVFIGYIVSRFMSGSIWNVAGSMRREQMTGTLETNFLITSRPWMLVLGSALSHSVQSTISAVLVLLLGWLTAGMRLHVSDLIPFLLIIVMVMGAAFGIGLFFAGVILLYREVDSIIRFLVYLQVAFSGFSFSIAAIPAFWRPLANIFPATWAIEGMRAVLLYDKNWSSIIQIASNLLVIDVILIICGAALFRRFERVTKLRGGLGAY